MSGQPGAETLPAEPETRSTYGELRYFTMSTAPETSAGTTRLEGQQGSHMELFHSGGAAKYIEVRLKPPPEVFSSKHCIYTVCAGFNLSFGSAQATQRRAPGRGFVLGQLMVEGWRHLPVLSSVYS